MYALQASYWALLSEAKIPVMQTGTAVGFISAAGYLPEAIVSQIYVKFGGWFGSTKINSGVDEVVQTVTSNKAFYLYLCVLFIIGFILAFIFKKIYCHNSDDLIECVNTDGSTRTLL